MAPDPSALNDALAPLRVKYLARLRETRQEIVDFHAACERDDATQAQREAMRQRAHKLSGTGKTYGFPAISETAYALEEALEGQAETGALTGFAQALLGSPISLFCVGRDRYPS